MHGTYWILSSFSWKAQQIYGTWNRITLVQGYQTHWVPQAEWGMWGHSVCQTSSVFQIWCAGPVWHGHCIESAPWTGSTPFVYCVPQNGIACHMQCTPDWLQVPHTVYGAEKGICHMQPKGPVCDLQAVPIMGWMGLHRLYLWNLYFGRSCKLYLLIVFQGCRISIIKLSPFFTCRIPGTTTPFVLGFNACLCITKPNPASSETLTKK